MLRYIFVCGHYLFQRASSIPSSTKTLSFEEQIMFKDKYRSKVKWRLLIPRIFPTFSGGMFSHVTRLGQSRANENIQ